MPTGSEDRRLAWYDLDLSSKPYKALRYHKAAVRGAAYHRGYPLFASSSDDGAVHVFHGMVYQARDVSDSVNDVRRIMFLMDLRQERMCS